MQRESELKIKPKKILQAEINTKSLVPLTGKVQRFWILKFFLESVLLCHDFFPPQASVLKPMESSSLQVGPLDFLRHCAQVGHGLSRSDSRRLRGLAEACKALLKERVRDHLQAHPQCPLLLQYSGDCTPVKLREYGSSGADAKRRRVSGHKTVEFYVHQVFCTLGLLDGSRLHSVLLGSPLALQHGKTMAALLPIALSCPGLHVPHEVGRLVIFHQVHDRAMSQSFRAALSGALAGQLTSSSASRSSTASSSSTTPTSASLLEWHTAVGCSCHDGHNSLKWAAQTLDDNAETLKNVHVGLQCLRRGFMSAVAALGPWLAENLQALRDDQLPDAEGLKQIYTLFGATEDHLPVLLRARPHWDAGMQKLKVSEAFLQESDSISELSGLLLDLWRFPAFSASRWVSMGCSARLYTLSQFTGFPHLYMSMEQQGLISEYDSAGVHKLQAKEQQWCLEVGAVASVADAFLCATLADSRVALNSHHIAVEVQAAFDHLEHMVSSAWRLLASQVALPPALLRDRVLRAAWVSLAYLDWRVFSIVTDLPWSLVAEGPSDAVDKLQSMEEPPSEQVAGKAWTLLHRGYSRQDLEIALGLLMNVSWTSAFTEKQHASTAVVRKCHADLSYEVMSARAYIHTVRSALKWAIMCMLGAPPRFGTQGSEPVRRAATKSCLFTSGVRVSVATRSSLSLVRPLCLCFCKTQNSTGAQEDLRTVTSLNFRQSS